MNSFTNGNNTRVESEFLCNLNKFRQTNFFAGIPPEAVKIIAFLCSREFFQKGDYLFNQNDDDGCAYYILSGRVTLTRMNNNTEIEIKDYGEDSFIGALSIIAPMPRLFSLKAASDTACLVMTREKFSRVLDQFPDITLKIIKALGDKIQDAEKDFIHDFESHGKKIKNLLGISLL